MQEGQQKAIHVVVLYEIAESLLSISSAFDFNVFLIMYADNVTFSLITIMSINPNSVLSVL